MLMYSSHSNAQSRIEPATLNIRYLGAHNFEQLANIYNSADSTFLIQLRRLRNSIVHYNGVYSASNVLDYTFGSNIYASIGNEGQIITIEFDSILIIYEQLRDIVRKGNVKYFSEYPVM